MCICKVIITKTCLFGDGLYHINKDTVKKIVEWFYCKFTDLLRRPDESQNNKIISNKTKKVFFSKGG